MLAVRRAERADEAEIERIVSEATRRAAGKSCQHEGPILVRRDADWWVAEGDGRILGAAALGTGSHDRLDILCIAVEDGAQDQGVGVELARYLLARLSAFNPP